jgi:predicted lipoprotein with Yx(FWY)xxD motif
MMQRTNGRAKSRDATGRQTIRTIAFLALAVGLGTAGFLAAGSIANGAGQTNATISLRSTKLGSILVNSKGHTLYLFKKDRNDKSACASTCATFWPPLLSRSKPTAGPGLKTSLLGTTRRSNGGLQVTYNKHPLYTFSLDKRAGQTNGEGNLAFGARWYAITAKGKPVTKTPPSPPPTTTTTTTTTPTYTYPTTTSSYP